MKYQRISKDLTLNKFIFSQGVNHIPIKSVDDDINHKIQKGSIMPKRKSRKNSQKNILAKSTNNKSGRPPAHQIQGLVEEGIRLINNGSYTEAGLALVKIFELDPENFDGWNLLGIASLKLGDFDKALEYFDKAVEINGKSPEARLNRALVLIDLGDLRNAEGALHTAIALRPNYTEAWNSLGLIRNNKKQWEAARKALEKALASDPNYPQAWVNLCATLQELKLYDDSIEAGMRGVQLCPDFAQAHYNLATAYYKNKEWKKAIVYFDRSIAIDPAYFPNYVNKSPCLCALGKFKEAEQVALKATELKPDSCEAYNNLGLTKFNQNDFAKAIEYYKIAIQFDEKSPSAHNNLSFALLMTEDFDTGWDEYEYGFEEKQRDPVADTPAPIWQGEPLDGKKIHVHGEQGVGEQIMFATMLPDLLSSGAQVIYDCDTRLVPLFNRSFPDIIVVPNTVPPDPLVLFDDIDYRISIGSLGKFYRRSIRDFVPRGKFLEPDQALSDRYRKKYRELGDGYKIGISWKSASPHHSVKKNASLELWAPVLKTPGCQFISLQYGEVDDDVKKVKRELGVDVFVDHEVSALNSLEQCAAQACAVDLVISISNATVHIAAACGVDTWMLLSEHPLWHWFLKREDSLWYSHVRKFRPHENQTIETTLDMIAKALPGYLEKSG